MNSTIIVCIATNISATAMDIQRKACRTLPGYRKEIPPWAMKAPTPANTTVSMVAEFRCSFLLERLASMDQ